MAKVRGSPLEVNPDRDVLASRHIDRLAAAMVSINASHTSASAGKSPALQATFLPRRHNSLFGFGRGIANKMRNVVHWGLLLHPPIRNRRPIGLSGKAQSRTATGRRTWRAGEGVRAGGSASRHRRGRVRQDEHARPSRRAFDRQRRRPARYPADDLLPSGGRRPR